VSGWWLLAPLAFIAMAGQDVLGVLMVQAEASYRAHRAAALDMAQDACRLAGLLINGGTVLLSHDLALSAAVIGATLAADYCATYAGVRLGERLDRNGKEPS
jgi:hypothetical protein